MYLRLVFEVVRLFEVGCIGTLGSVAFTGTDVNDLCLVENPVDDGMGERGITKGLSPLFKADACGKDHGESLMTGTDQVEQKAWILRPGSNEVHPVYNQQM